MRRTVAAFATAHRVCPRCDRRSTPRARRYKRTGTLFLRDRQKHFFLDDATVSKWVRLRRTADSAQIHGRHQPRRRPRSRPHREPTRRPHPSPTQSELLRTTLSYSELLRTTQSYSELLRATLNYSGARSELLSRPRFAILWPRRRREDTWDRQANARAASREHLHGQGTTALHVRRLCASVILGLLLTIHLSHLYHLGRRRTAWSLRFSRWIRRGRRAPHCLYIASA